MNERERPNGLRPADVAPLRSTTRLTQTVGRLHYAEQEANITPKAMI